MRWRCPHLDRAFLILLSESGSTTLHDIELDGRPGRELEGGINALRWAAVPSERTLKELTENADNS